MAENLTFQDTAGVSLGPGEVRVVDLTGRPEPQTGEIEIRLQRKDAGPYSGEVYLIPRFQAPPRPFYTVTVTEGVGRAELPAGPYRISTSPPDEQDVRQQNLMALDVDPAFIQFETGSASLSADGKNALATFARTAASALGLSGVRYTGYAEESPASSTALQNLMIQRATTVKNELSGRLERSGLRTLEHRTEVDPALPPQEINSSVRVQLTSGPLLGQGAGGAGGVSVDPYFVVDYYMGESARFASVEDPLYLLRPEGSSYWSLGKRGWIILGFRDGFETGPEQIVRFRERFIRETVDVWVARRINNDHPVNYIADADVPPGVRPRQRYARMATKGRTGPTLGPAGPRVFQGTAQPVADSPTLPVGGLIRPAWVPDEWVYVGAVRGTDAGWVNAASADDGPHLGNIPAGRYYYALLHDNGDRTNSEGGAEVAQFGVFVQGARKKNKGYFLLVLDDSKSAEGTLAAYRAAIKEQLRYWFNLKGMNEKFLGVRMMRWKGARPWCDGQRPNLATYKTEYQDKAAKPELTVRLPFGSGLWLPFGTDLDAFLTVAETVILGADGLKLQGDYTPLIETLDDVYHQDFRKIEGLTAYSQPFNFSVGIISDGLQDPCNLFSSPDTVAETDANADLIRKFITGDPAQPGIEYSVKSKLEKLKPVVMGQRLKLEGKFPSGVGNWIPKYYDEKLKDLIKLIEIDPAQVAADPLVPIDPNEIFHTDSLDADRSALRRIAAGAKKRVVTDPGTGAPVRLPVAWGGTLEDLTPYSETKASPNF